MATLTHYFANGTYPGAKENIWVPPVCIGSGQIVAFSAFLCLFVGRIEHWTSPGDLKIEMNLTDQDPAAQSGPVEVSLTFKETVLVDKNAKYHIDTSRLVLACTFSGKQQQITIYPISTWGKTNNETEIDLTGAYSAGIHLAPA